MGVILSCFMYNSLIFLARTVDATLYEFLHSFCSQSISWQIDCFLICYWELHRIDLSQVSCWESGSLIRWIFKFLWEIKIDPRWLYTPLNFIGFHSWEISKIASYLVHGNPRKFPLTHRDLRISKISVRKQRTEAFFFLMKFPFE